MNKRDRHRKIIHVDMDCFFAAIEMRENPKLKHKPVAVGGSANSRGVVATCSYEARQYGIHSAMPMATAIKKCPQLVCLPVRMPLYKQVSADIQAIFQDYTHIVEPLSLDEAYLDVSHVKQHRGSASLIAEEIRQRIFHSQNLTASAGVAENKLLAKIASDWNKPNGLTIITPDRSREFIKNVPVKHIPGVGKVTAEKMQKMGIITCKDLQNFRLPELQQHFGKFGQRLYDAARGIDHRPVQTSSTRKSLSIEDTFSNDLPSLDSCIAMIPVLYPQLEQRLKRAKQRQALPIKNLFLKMRFFDFTTTTLQMPGSRPSVSAYQHLCQQIWQRGKKPVRLLGLGIQFHEPDAPEQMLLL